MSDKSTTTPDSGQLKVNVTFWVSPEFRDRLHEMARAQERSLSGMIRRILMRELD